MSRDRIFSAVRDLNRYRYENRKPVSGIFISESGYDLQETFRREDHEWSLFPDGATWGGSDRHFWFYADIITDRLSEGKKVIAILNTGATDIWNTDNPQILVYRNGDLAGTMDMNHQEIILTEKAERNEKFSLSFYAYSNSASDSNFFRLETAVKNDDAEKLYYDLKVPFEAAEFMRDEDPEKIRTMDILSNAVNLLERSDPYSREFRASVKKADRYLEEHYYADRPENPVTVYSTGHTHIDVAWKWPVRQTEEKAVRSFLTAANLMDRYPEFTFMTSQPILLDFVREKAPHLFRRIKERIREGRWETEGGMWLESDCNLTSGESMIRQILYGKEFLRRQFGVRTSEVLWLPDAFGYSAALPQIMKQCGMNYFVTTKIGWNDTNPFPYDTFRWEGIDGTKILSYLITTTEYHTKSWNTTYNGLQNVSQIMGTWKRYQNKDISSDVLTCYGYGDGGGGPTETMLEESRRMEKSVGSCPRTKQSRVRDFLQHLEETADPEKIPVWSGELYLEYHRGTYTSEACAKRNNRRGEFLNADTELFSETAGLMDSGFSYPKEKLDRCWKLLLLNQFHDILPGSAIGEVYEEAAKQYSELFRTDLELIGRAQKSIAESIREKQTGAKKGRVLCAFNQTGFSRTSLVPVIGKPEGEEVPFQEMADGSSLCLLQDVPAYGVKTFASAASKHRKAVRTDKVITDIRYGSGKRIVSFTTPFYRIGFNEAGEMTSVYDLSGKREILRENGTGNRITAYEDRPKDFDAWNIDRDYRERYETVTSMESMELTENGPLCGCLKIRRRLRNSVIEQKICFYAHTRRIDFVTMADWKEHQTLLRTSFETDLFTGKATYDIAFGNVERPTHRNTGWDRAKFEVSAHKWEDLSEPGYGVALLNDCKYGCDIHDGVLSLTLIKAGIDPNPDADICQHEFTYALFPHEGDFRSGGVIKEAEDLNRPLYASFEDGMPAFSGSFFSVSEENVILETVKRAENSDGCIVRVFEAHGKRTEVTLRSELLSFRDVTECNCLEKNLKKIPAAEKEFRFMIKPYEIRTFRIRMK
jgi:alpha-mannosidase